MTDEEYQAAISRSGLPLTPETIAELARARPIVETFIARVTRDKPPTVEPALVFQPEQRP